MAKKQTELPGTERPSIPQIDDRAAAYRDMRDKRMILQTKESEAKELLLEAMREHEEELEENDDGNPTYVYWDGDTPFAVVHNQRESVSVRKIASPAEGELG